MDELIGFFFTVVIIAVACIISPITVLIHELGHAIPTLLFTTKEVEIYIGSYGNSEGNLPIKIGRLKIFFKYNVLLWNAGLCTRKEGAISIWKELIILFSGPVFSLVSGVFVCYCSFFYSSDEKIHFLGFIFLGSSILDFSANIFPNQRSIRLDDGSLVYNDGQQIIQLIKYRILPLEYRVANKLYNQKEYGKAGEIYLKMLNKGIIKHYIFKMTILSLLFAKVYEKAKKTHYQFAYQFHLDSNDYSNMGYIYAELNDLDKSIEMYEESLKINPKNIDALNNRGYQYTLKKEFEKAIIDFDKAIALNEDYTYALNNRGYVKMELGLLEEGLVDIKQSILKDGNNPHAHRNLGIYYLYTKNKQQAITSLERAYALDADTHLINELIEKAKNI